jgi:hypothetical protein
VLEHVELNGLGKGSALADSHHVTLTHVLEAGGAVDRHVGVALFETDLINAESEKYIHSNKGHI